MGTCPPLITGLAATASTHLLRSQAIELEGLERAVRNCAGLERLDRQAPGELWWKTAVPGNENGGPLTEVVTKYNIEVQNIYNFDEKGIQLGGGRKGMSGQYLWHPMDKFKYVQKSDSLVLITVIEGAAADGATVPPGFILPPGEISDWSDVPGVGRYIYLLIRTLLI